METIGWTDLWKIKKSYIESRRKDLPHIKYKEESLTGLAISCLETALYNKLFKDK
jgi:hypothetical protein